ncbi:SDR family oxidoreductase [Litoribacillus peritrichatus]|uniref:SDR family oxidoreductase n=1 Tax=Litoribacillus peritrichatus TaxID=718191 RepID=A0ABP7NFU5_9GAMM
MNTASTKVLIAGFGDVGQRIAEQLLNMPQHSATPFDISAIKRSPLPDPFQQTVTAIHWDMSQPFNQPLPAFDYVVFCASADDHSEAGYQTTYLDAQQNLLTALSQQPTPIKRYFFCSSSSVYGQTDHEWVNETSLTQPTRFTGVKMLEAEELVANTTLCPVTIVRATGIYGPGRSRMIQQVLQGKVSSEQPVHYSNRIHADDLARFYAYLIEQDLQGVALSDLYLACDDEPVTMHEVQSWMANYMRIEVKELVPAGRTGSKRISNQRMKATGFQLLYPSYQQGMPAQLDAALNH